MVELLGLLRPREVVRYYCTLRHSQFSKSAAPACLPFLRWQSFVAQKRVATLVSCYASCLVYLLCLLRTLNKVVVTGSGMSVLKHALKADAEIAGRPLVRLAMASVNAHERGKPYKNRLGATKQQ